MGLSTAHLTAILCFSMWGLFPIYWKFFPELGAWELFAHRLIWSFITLLLILCFKKKLSSLKIIWQNPKSRYMLMISAILISSNWLIYIYAVSIGQILEASMGYFLNPLINVFLGWMILKEKIRPLQWPAIGVALIGVILIGLQSGIENFPWIALSLSLTFAGYGLIRKVAQVGSMEGLAFETAFIVIPTLLIWQFIPSSPFDIFFKLSNEKILLLSLVGFITCTPLILFAYSARRLPFGTLGFLSYLSPSLKFLCGLVIFNENLGAQKLQAFCFIWFALLWYTGESFYVRSKRDK